MFTEVATEDVLSVVRAHDFGDEPAIKFGAARIDAIVALERLNRATQAEMVAQIAALHERGRTTTGLDPVSDGHACRFAPKCPADHQSPQSPR